MPPCPACGQEVAPEDVFCRRCGKSLRPADNQREAFLGELGARFEQRLKEQAGDTDAAYNLALTHFYAGKYAAAIPHLRRVLEDLPDLADARAKLAVALWQTGEHTEALQAMERAVEQSPADERLRRLVEQMREELGRSSGPLLAH
jgi:tetratricopeptide (TPR) repeat protein